MLQEEAPYQQRLEKFNKNPILGDQMNASV